MEDENKTTAEFLREIATQLETERKVVQQIIVHCKRILFIEPGWPDPNDTPSSVRTSVGYEREKLRTLIQRIEAGDPFDDYQ